VISVLTLFIVIASSRPVNVCYKSKIRYRAGRS